LNGHIGSPKLFVLFCASSGRRRSRARTHRARARAGRNRLTR
jgi:hypothetical protein